MQSRGSVKKALLNEMSFLHDIQRFSAEKLRYVKTRVTTAEGKKVKRYLVWRYFLLGVGQEKTLVL